MMTGIQSKYDETPTGACRIHISILAALLLASTPAFSQWTRFAGPSFSFTTNVHDVVVDDSGDVFAGIDWGILRSSNNGALWKWTGLSRRAVYDLTIDSAGTIFAGTDNGVLRSTDRGSTWSNTYLPPSEIHSIAVVSPECILAGTYQGVYRSTDGGTTWLGTMPTVAFLSLVVSRPGVVTAATSEGIYRSTDEGISWDPLGILTGWFHSVAADPSGRLFASNYLCYRSTDDGQTWTQLSPQSVFSLAVNDSGVIFAGGYEGVYYSFDGGDKWSRFQLRGRTVNAIAFGDSGRIYSGTDRGVYSCILNPRRVNSTVFGLETFALMEQLDGTLLAGTLDGVYRSSDGGASWDTSGLSGRTVRSLAKNELGNIFAGTDSSIYRSTDMGASWDTVQMPIRTTLALAAKDTNLVFAGENDGIYRSTDGGSTWNQVFNSILTRSMVAVTGGPVVAATVAGTWTSTNNGDSWTWYNTGDTKCITRGPTGTFYVSSEYGFFRSLNGVTWTNLNSNIRGGDAIAALPSHVFVAVGMEILNSLDGGSNWSSLAIISSAVHSLLVRSDTLFAGTADGVFVISDLSSSPVEFQTGIIDGEQMPINSVVDMGGQGLLMGTPYAIYRSTDGAATWDVNFVVASGGTFSLARDSSGNVFAAGLDIFRSTDFGDTWTASSIGPLYVNTLAVASGHLWSSSWTAVYHSTNGGATWSQSPSPTHFTALAANDSGRLFAGSSQGVYRTSDGGLTWQPPSMQTNIASLAVNIWGDLFAATPVGVQKSTDNGESWTVATSDITSNSVNFIGIAGPHFLLAGGVDGIIVGSNRGENWYSFDDGLDSSAQVLGLAIDDSYLLLGTSSGLWKRPLAELAATGIESQTAALPASFRLDQNYPNPFNPMTVISYQLSVHSRVSLRVYDILGRVVATLVDGEQPAGFYRTEWNAGISSGVYFYRLEAVGDNGNVFVAVRKMVLLR